MFRAFPSDFRRSVYRDESFHRIILRQSAKRTLDQDRQNNGSGEDRSHRYRSEEFDKWLEGGYQHRLFGMAKHYLLKVVYYFVPLVPALRNVLHRMPEIPKFYHRDRICHRSDLRVVYDISPVEFLKVEKNNLSKISTPPLPNGR